MTDAVLRRSGSSTHTFQLTVREKTWDCCKIRAGRLYCTRCTQTIHLFDEKGDERDRDMRDVVKKILGGAWSDFPPEDISLSPIGGGITNLLFKAEGPEGEQPALIRLYGDNTDILIDRERDNALFHELAALGYAPPYHGRFENGRVEGFMFARALQPHEMSLRKPIDFLSFIAAEMARLHGLPVTKAGPRGKAEIWDKLPKWLHLAQELRFEDQTKADAVQALDVNWMIREAAWAERQLRFSTDGLVVNGSSAAKSETDPREDTGAVKTENGPTGTSPENNGGGTNGMPAGTGHGDEAVTVERRAKRYLSEVVLSHNDLLSGNIMYNKAWDRVQVIDFEYSGYNPRGFDIANHFCEHAGFDSNFAESYPSEDTKTAFLTAFVRETERRKSDEIDSSVATRSSARSNNEAKAHPRNGMTGSTHDTPHNGTQEIGASLQEDGDVTKMSPGGEELNSSPHCDEAFIAALCTEVDRWTLLSHLWWSAWAIVQARYSPIDFDFVDYARLRLAGYRLHKKVFFGVEDEVI